MKGGNVSLRYCPRATWACQRGLWYTESGANFRYNDAEHGTKKLNLSVPGKISPSGILLHDYFEICGGGERLALMLSKGLDLELCYGFWTEDSYEMSEAEGLTTRELNTFSRLSGWRTIKQMLAFRRRTRFLRDYELAIYSGVGAPLAVTNHQTGRNVFYCHTPPRFAYDQYDYYQSLLPNWQKPLLTSLSNYVKPLYENAVRSMDLIIANSRNVQSRIHEYLGMESQVIYPPVDTRRFSWIEQGDYFLSTARLDPLKRVDTVIKAFRLLPEQKLIITSGGSELERLKALAEGTTNIHITGWVSEAKLRELVGGARATIYIPRDEDFGMSPVESMAAGKPVIGVRSGGLLETVIPGRTGSLIAADPHPEELCDAVDELTAERALSMRQDCEARAQEFRESVFLQRMADAINSLPGARKAAA